MKIVFVSNSFHHHQKGVADALYAYTKGSYCFITTEKMSEERKRMGFNNVYPPYVVDASDKKPENLRDIQKIIDEAEVVVLGSAPFELLRNRLKEGKITFRYSEHLWKQYRHYLKIPFYIFQNKITEGCRLLCSSAYASHDYNAMGAFKDKCYKWGYFTEVPSELSRTQHTENSPIRIMWCSRYLDWKHPELPIYLAKKLKESSFRFKINMYGSGRYYRQSVNLVNSLNLDDVIDFKGNVPNQAIHDAMRNSDIFLLTSDRGEGWGAVANEAMSNGCVLVASNDIGSVPYLVRDKKNGCIFKGSSRMKGFCPLGISVDNKSLTSLYNVVKWLIENPAERKKISLNAFHTMRTTWNPEVAAKNLLTLIDDIQQGRETSIDEGPCSKA